MMQSEILRIEKLCKSFGPTKANVDIDFTLCKGEVRGLVGENGSGKSTLLSQIAGLNISDSGTMYVNGAAYAPNSPMDAYARGIGIVVQELGVIGSLPAGINVFLGRTGRYSKAGILSMKKMNEEIQLLSEKWQIKDIPFNAITGTLSVELRKQIELLRALAIDPEILILDEITQALSYDNRKRLYDLIHKFKEMGRSVLIISHDLDEIVELADSLTILRDGRVVDTVTTNDLSMEQLKRMMVGREMAGDYYRVDIEPSRSEKIVISVRNLKVANEVKGLSFEVHEGEILGLCGLSDSGIHAIGKAMYGLESDVEGDVILHTAANDSVKIDSSRTALCHGMAYVPKERDGEGLMLHASIRDNLCLPSLNELTDRVGMLWQKQKNLTANRAKDEFSVRCQDVLQEVGGLSGGNKQKINLGRWLAKDLTLLILDCPTRGVDIGVKAYIYGLMKDLKAKGLAIVLISDELLEVLGMSDRILVIKNGELAEEVPRGMRFSEEEIIEVML